MSITIDWKGKQITCFPEKKNQTLRIPFQKEVKPGDKIVVDKVLKRDEEFGQPYLPIKVILEVIRNGKNKKIVGMRYKPKKRTKRKWGFRAQYTEAKIVGVEQTNDKLR